MLNERLIRSHLSPVGYHDCISCLCYALPAWKMYKITDFHTASLYHSLPVKCVVLNPNDIMRLNTITVMDVLKALVYGSYTVNTSYLKTTWYPTVPEGVPHSVSETDEALLVFSHEITCVKVGIPLHKHISQQLLLSQLFASSIAKERSEGAHLGQ